MHKRIFLLIPLLSIPGCQFLDEKTNLDKAYSEATSSVGLAYKNAEFEVRIREWAQSCAD